MATFARSSSYLPAPTRRPALQLARGMVTLFDAWLERRRQRRALLELSDHMLKDIGVSRSDAVQEGMKPFWQG